MLAQKTKDKYYLNLIILRNVKMFHTSTSQWIFFIELSYFVQHAVTLSLGCSNNKKQSDWEETTLVIELTSHHFQNIFSEARPLVFVRGVCLFDCFSSHFRIFHSYGDHHHFRWRAANLIYARHSWSLNKYLPHLLWHGASVYSDHHRGPVTLTPVAERLAVELSRPVFTT